MLALAIFRCIRQESLRVQSILFSIHIHLTCLQQAYAGSEACEWSKCSARYDASVVFLCLIAMSWEYVSCSLARKRQAARRKPTVCREASQRDIIYVLSGRRGNTAFSCWLRFLEAALHQAVIAHPSARPITGAPPPLCYATKPLPTRQQRQFNRPELFVRL